MVVNLKKETVERSMREFLDWVNWEERPILAVGGTIHRQEQSKLTVDAM